MGVAFVEGNCLDFLWVGGISVFF